jgi:S-adenosylhomocysteine hydrolase
MPLSPKGNTILLPFLHILTAHTLALEIRLKSTSQHFAHTFVTMKTHVHIFALRNKEAAIYFDFFHQVLEFRV